MNNTGCILMTQVIIRMKDILSLLKWLKSTHLWRTSFFDVRFHTSRNRGSADNHTLTLWLHKNVHGLFFFLKNDTIKKEELLMYTCYQLSYIFRRPKQPKIPRKIKTQHWLTMNCTPPGEQVRMGSEIHYFISKDVSEPQ